VHGYGKVFACYVESTLLACQLQIHFTHLPSCQLHTPLVHHVVKFTSPLFFFPLLPTLGTRQR
jgi:hypothetical protein